MSEYFKNISDGISTTLTGMRLTLRHLWNARKSRKPADIRSSDFYDQQDGIVTIQYPLETIPIPDNGRYRLHNEMDDCIVCDKCAKVCPVDCIDIEPIKAVEDVGRASDGSPIRLYAARFDIDMAKCCYCGLCTTVCPTECLTMTKTFDYSELDVRDMVYNYSNLTTEQADEKRALLEQFQREKEALKAAKAAGATATSPTSASAVPGNAAPGAAAPGAAAPGAVAPARPVFKPTIKPKTTEEAVAKAEPTEAAEPTRPAPKPAFKPVMKPKAPAENAPTETEPTEKPAAAKPIFRPTQKPKVVPDENIEKPVSGTQTEPVEKPAEPVEKPVAKAPFRPTMKPKVVSDENVEKPVAETPSEHVEKPAEPVEKPAAKAPFRPTMKPKPKE
ncbi:hypothetical protein GCM10010967_00760 [Dyadobacter beijingensis]|uniref:4Fe-4S ferredoxin-type domain-containing protein n=1 Tax=Dyadobacter beijingensis TaxID=365489 RepID=A0ABQ2HBJ6_9BACT|nr:4Fe-4S binding protein [Dyadobacter beijingensis]GGM73120.1 hypothetical protein GCM10010967_00760 [Dyadobacter beijingensis]